MAEAGTRATETGRRRGRPARAEGGGTEVQTLSRALCVLECIAGSRDGISLSDVARQADLAASTVHRLLNTLERHGFARVDAGRGTWSVGIKAFSVGNAFLASRDFVATARRFMHRLMEEAGESVNLAILDEGEAVFLSQVECREMMRMFVRLGGRAPAHASGVGKALLAALPQETLDGVVARHGLARYTGNTIAAPGMLRDELARVRRAGYAVDDEEHAVGLRCVAATVHDQHAEALAAISLSGPRARIGDERLPVLGSLVRRTADQVTEAVGGIPPAWRLPERRQP